MSRDEEEQPDCWRSEETVRAIATCKRDEEEKEEAACQKRLLDQDYGRCKNDIQK